MSCLRGVASALLVLACASGAVAAPGETSKLGNKLEKAVAANAGEAIQETLRELIAAGGPDALEEVLKLLPKLERVQNDAVYWQLVTAASGFRDQAALEALGEFVAKKGKGAGFSRDLVFGLENNPSPHVAAALGPILRTGPYDMQLMAADQLARIRTVASVDLMIEILEKEGDKGDAELKRRLVTALGAVTGESMGDAVNWIGWWKANRQNGLPDKGGQGHSGGGLASQVMDPNRKREFESLTKDPKRVIVISSQVPKDAPHQAGQDYNYDHMEQILTQMEIAHTVVLKDEFSKDPDKYLKDAWTVLVNCGNIQTFCVCKECRRLLAEKKAKGVAGGMTNRLYGCPPECGVHENYSYKLEKSAIERLKQWVEAGGYLFTEDWGLVEIIDACWPNLVSSNKGAEPGPDGKPQQTIKLIRSLSDKKDPKSVVQGGDMDVIITPGRGLTSLPLMRGVFARPRPPAREKSADAPDEGDGTRIRQLPPTEDPTSAPSHSWTIDDESPAVQVQDRKRVTVLLESQELAGIIGGDEAVGVTFVVGRGGAPVPMAPPKRPKTGSGGGDSGKSRERIGGGRVLHCLSHFGHQQKNVRDTFVLQNLILNFIMESNAQHAP